MDAALFKIGYGISTLPGQSGCPVVVEGSIIAVHVGGDKEQFNVGRVVDESLVNSLSTWTTQLKAESVQLKSQNLCPHLQEKMK